MGNDVAWDPERYVHGNYFQHEISEIFRKRIQAKLFGMILDVGCGDGQYSRLFADKAHQAKILGIDSSVDMIRHANHHWSCEGLSFEVHCIEEFQPEFLFDFVLSFWCLHWTNIEISFANIFHALKNGGKLYAVLSSFSDNSILQTWHELSKQSRYHHLKEKYPDTTNKSYLYQVISALYKLPFKQIKIDSQIIRIQFPHIDYFKNLLLTMPFMKKYSVEMIEDMVNAFQTICRRKYGGVLFYETRPIFLEVIK